MSETKTTHGLSIRAEDKGVTREMDLCRQDDGGFVVRMATHWSGKAEPIATIFRLSPVGLHMLSNLLDAAHHLHEFPVNPEAFEKKEVYGY